MMGAERGGKELDSQNLLSFVPLKIAFVGELLSVSLSLTSFSRSSRFDRSRSREREIRAQRVLPDAFLFFIFLLHWM